MRKLHLHIPKTKPDRFVGGFALGVLLSCAVLIAASVLLQMHASQLAPSSVVNGNITTASSQSSSNTANKKTIAWNIANTDYALMYPEITGASAEQTKDVVTIKSTEFEWNMMFATVVPEIAVPLPEVYIEITNDLMNVNLIRSVQPDKLDLFNEYTYIERNSNNVAGSNYVEVVQTRFFTFACKAKTVSGLQACDQITRGFELRKK